MTERHAVRVLDVHAGYRCRHSGACCTAGRDIAAEPQTVAAVRAVPALGDFRTAGFRPASTPEGGSLQRLARRQHGHCAFYDPAAAGSCLIHREVGHAALPLACRQFSRLTLDDDRGTFVTLSHFCPTAAAQLFDDGRTLASIEAPDGFPADGEYVGLDARGLDDGSLRWTAACVAAWHDASRPLCRDLGTHAFANWTAYQGRGIRTEVRRLRAALEIVRLETARGLASNRPGVDAAIGRTDLLLHHLIDPLAFARGLDAFERAALGSPWP